jgi:hypothetical protein
MAATQRNFNFSQYVSDDGTTYCLKASQEWISAAGNPGGSVTCSGNPAYGRATTRRSPRKVVYRDATTFRTVTVPVFTPTAYAAISVGSSTLPIMIPGETGSVTYTAVKKVPERIPSTVIGRQDPDHA